MNSNRNTAADIYRPIQIEGYRSYSISSTGVVCRADGSRCKEVRKEPRCVILVNDADPSGRGGFPFRVDALVNSAWG